MKISNKKTSFTIITLMLVACLITTVYAIISFLIPYTYEVNNINNNFYIQTVDQLYYQEENSGSVDKEIQLNILNYQAEIEVESGNLFDFVIISNDDNLGLNIGTTLLQESQKIITSDDNYAYIYSMLTHDKTTNYTVTTNGNVNAYPVAYFAENEYVSSVEDLILLSSHYNENVNGAVNKIYNLHLVGDITVNQELRLNLACYINLHLNTIILNENLTLFHNNYGTFAVESLSGIENCGKIESIDKKIIIDAPLATYLTHELDSDSLNNIDISNTKFDMDNLTETQKTELLNDAMQYAKAQLPNIIYQSIPTLINKFHYYPIDIEYIFKDSDDNIIGSNLREDIDEFTTLDTTINIYLEDELSLTDTKTVNVTGTSKSALISALGLEIKSYVEGNYQRLIQYEDGHENIGLVNKAVLNELISSTIKQFSDNNQTILDNFVGDYFLTLKNGYIKFEDILGNVQNLYDDIKISIVKTGEELSYEIFAGDRKIDTELYISLEVFVLQNQISSLELSTVDNSVIKTKSVDISAAKNCDSDARDLYLNRYVNEVIIDQSNNLESIIGLSVDNKIVYGANIIIKDTNLFINQEYGVYVLDSDKYNAINKDTYPLSDAIADSLDVTEEFDFTTSGYLKAKDDAVVSLIPGEILFYAVKLTNSENVSFESHNIIFWPKQGIGGGGESDYYNGDTFKEFFDDNKEIIDNNDIIGDNEFKVTSDFKLIMTVENEDVSEYCNLIKDSKTGAYQINVVTENIPVLDTLITIKCEFYTKSEGSTAFDDLVSTQYYLFKIPGILTCGDANAEFHDDNLYNYLLHIKDDLGDYVYKSYKHEYLLNDFGNTNIELDFTKTINYQDLDGNDVNVKLTNINPIGLEYLTNTTKMIFDGIEFDNLNSFAALKQVESLSLNNCKITDDLITTSSNALSQMSSLESLYLDNNMIAGGNNYFYRTINLLSLKNQNIEGVKILNNIKWLHDLPNLETLFLDDNNISNFSPLKKLEDLKDVYINGNEGTDFSGKPSSDKLDYYGTNGEINKITYIDLIIRNVNIHILKNSTDHILSIGDSSTDDFTNTELKNIINASAVMYASSASTIEIFKNSGQTINIKYIVDPATNQVVTPQINNGQDKIVITNETNNIFVIIEIDGIYNLLEFNKI